MTAAALTANVTPLDAGAPVAAAGFLGDIPALALEDGTVLFRDARQRTAHHRASGRRHSRPPPLRRVILSPAAMTAAWWLSRKMAPPKKSPTKKANGSTRSPHGTMARSPGPAARTSAPAIITASSRPLPRHRPCAGLPSCRRATGSQSPITMAQACGFRIPPHRPSRSNGKAPISPSTVSPDGRFLVTSMQENTLHGWRIADKKDMRMSGYPAKTRSLSWSFDGQWLATSGADAAIIWPFKDKEGPIDKAPLECGARQVRVTCGRLSSEIACRGAGL